jgi:hypothetical protein
MIVFFILDSFGSSALLNVGAPGFLFGLYALARPQSRLRSLASRAARLILAVRSALSSVQIPESISTKKTTSRVVFFVLGRQDLNLGMLESKSSGLPLADAPNGVFSDSMFI